MNYEELEERRLDLAEREIAVRERAYEDQTKALWDEVDRLKADSATYRGEVDQRREDRQKERQEWRDHVGFIEKHTELTHQMLERIATALETANGQAP